MLFSQRRLHGMSPLLIGLILVSALATRAQKADPERTQTSGTISGRVVGQGGEAMNGATAFAVPIGILGQTRSVAVDRNGSFKFDGLDAGVYVISAALPGFTSPVIHPDQPRRYSHPGDSVTLTLIRGGVINGTVTTDTNLPVVAAAVRAFRIKDVNGQREPAALQPRERQTDDRGVYRIYGLPPGIYLISAGGQGRSFGGPPGAYDSDVPVYAPSSTRDTAMEVLVNSGEEITADIQYHSENGHAVSGTVAGLSQASANALSVASGTVSLTDLRTHAVVMSAGSSSVTGNTFAFYGAPNGEYEIVAQQFLPSRDTLVSEPRRITVQGTDVTGIGLSLAPLGSISGRVVIESNPPADCVQRRGTALAEVVIDGTRLKPETKAANPNATGTEPVVYIPLVGSNQVTISVLDAKGDFLLRNLQPGTYRVAAQLPGAGFYLRSMSMGTPQMTAKASQPNVARDGLVLKTGERVSGLTMTIAEGAAGLRGHMSVAECQRLTANLRIYLVPAEREAAENVLRFFEAVPDSSGGFAIDYIAPGRYWILSRVADEGDPTKVNPIRHDSSLRTKVLKGAEALKKEISFKPCQQSADYDLPWTP